MGLPNSSPCVETVHDAINGDAVVDALEPLLQVRRMLEDTLEDCRRYSAMISYYFKTEPRCHDRSECHVKVMH
jgi:hypothetical protein